MTLSHNNMTVADFSNRVKGGGWSPRSVIGGCLLSLLAAPGAASAPCLRSYFLNSSCPQQSQPLSYAPVEASASVSPIGDLINTIRNDWPLNMTELAEILGVSRPTIYNWLKGKGAPDSELQRHLQTLAAAAAGWKESTAGSNWDFLLDYTGPKADQETIRATLKRPEVSANEIRDLIRLRLEQYKEAYAQSREILGEPAPLPSSMPPDSARRLNALWAENAKALHAARNR